MSPDFQRFLDWLDEDPRRYLNFITVKTNQTKPMTKDKYKHAMEIIDAIEAGKGIEYSNQNPPPRWLPDSNPDQWSLENLNDPTKVRIKPTPSKVPFGPGDITGDMWFRFRNDLEWHRVSAFGHSQVRLSNGAKLSYSDLAASLTYRRDGWPMERDEKCEKPSEPPPKREPRRVWVNISKEKPHQFLHLTPEEAKACAHPDWCSEAAVEFVEVLR